MGSGNIYLRDRIREIMAREKFEKSKHIGIFMKHLCSILLHESILEKKMLSVEI